MLLLDGRVLVVGGPIETISDANSAELYDPGTGRWATTGSMIAQRFAYTATLLRRWQGTRSGRRWPGSHLPSSTIRSAEHGLPPGPWRPRRYYHTAALLRDGKVLVAGGIVAGDSSRDDQVPSSELYDPVSGTWTATGAMATDRFGHTATLLADGKVLVAAGYQADVPKGPYAEIYDPISGTWTAAGNMITPTPRADSTATLLPDGKVLVAGGTTDGRNPRGLGRAVRPADRGVDALHKA